ARTVLLAGNHDLRTLLGLLYAGATDPRHAHLFARLGQKSLRLFQEVYEEYLAGAGKKLLSVPEAKKRLFPGSTWYTEFPKVARGLVPEKKLEKELVRIREKEADIISACSSGSFTLPMLWAAIQKCKKLFLGKGGEFCWLGQQMELAYRAG